MTRTFYCKSVDDEQANIHDIVRTAVEKAEAAIKPGARFCDIDAQARDYICLLYTSNGSTVHIQFAKIKSKILSNCY